METFEDWFEDNCGWTSACPKLRPDTHYQAYQSVKEYCENGHWGDEEVGDYEDHPYKIDIYDEDIRRCAKFLVKCMSGWAGTGSEDRKYIRFWLYKENYLHISPKSKNFKFMFI